MRERLARASEAHVAYQTSPWSSSPVGTRCSRAPGTARTKASLKVHALTCGGPSSSLPSPGSAASALPRHARDGGSTASTSGRALTLPTGWRDTGFAQRSRQGSGSFWQQPCTPRARCLPCGSSTSSFAGVSLDTSSSSQHHPALDALTSSLEPSTHSSGTGAVPLSKQQAVSGSHGEPLSNTPCPTSVKLLSTPPLHSSSGATAYAAKGLDVSTGAGSSGGSTGLHWAALDHTQQHEGDDHLPSDSTGQGEWAGQRASATRSSTRPAPAASNGSAGAEQYSATVTPREDSQSWQQGTQASAGLDDTSWQWQAAPMFPTSPPHEPSLLDPDNPMQSARSLQPWHKDPRVITALLIRTHRLGRYERILEQHAEFLNSRHISIALTILPGIASLARGRLMDEMEQQQEQRQQEEQRLQQQEQQQQGLGQGPGQQHTDTGASRDSITRSHAGGDSPNVVQDSDKPDAQDQGTWEDSSSPVPCGVGYPHGMQHTLKTRERRVRVRTLAARLAQAFERHLRKHVYTPHDLAIALWALGRVGYQPSPAWFAYVYKKCRQKLNGFEPQQMSYMLWGVATLGVDPGNQWVGSVQRRLLAMARDGMLQAPQLAVTLWAVAKVATLPSREPAMDQGGEKQAAGGDSSVGDTFNASGSDEWSDDEGPEPAASAQGPRSLPQPEGQPEQATWQPPVSTSRPGSGSVPYNRLNKAWLDAYLSVLATQLHAFEARHLCMTLSALSHVHHLPSEAVLQPLLQMVLYRCTSPGSAATVLWALARLRYRPQRGWLQQYLEVVSPLVPEMSCQELSNSLWALAALQAEPQEELLRKYEAAAYEALEDFAPQGLASMVWAMAKLGFRPRVAWMEKVAQVSSAQLDSFCPQSQSMLLWGMATLQYSPHPHPTWIRNFTDRTAFRLHTGSPQSLANSVAALAKLSNSKGGAFAGEGRAVGPAWVSAFLSASGQLLKRQKLVAATVAASTHSQAMQAALAAQRRSRNQPQTADVEGDQQQAVDAEQAQQQQQPGEQQPEHQQQSTAMPSTSPSQESAPREAALSPSSVSEGPASGPSALQDSSSQRAAAAARVAAAARLAAAEAAAAAVVPIALATASAGFNALELPHVLWALAKMRLYPGAAWLGAAESVALPMVPVMTAASTSLLLYSLATLPRQGAAPASGELLGAAVARLSYLLQNQPHTIKSQDVCNSLWALAKMGYEPEPVTLQLLMEAGERLLPGSSHAQHAQLLWAACRFGVVVPPRLLTQLVQLTTPMLATMPYLSLVTLLACMARLDHRPPEAWVQQAAAAANRAAASAQVLALPAAQRSKMADWASMSLEKLGFFAEDQGDEGAHMWVLPQQLVGAAGSGE